MKGMSDDLLRSMMGAVSGFKDTNLDMKQLNSFWRMLDDMADNDPESYKKFIG